MSDGELLLATLVVLYLLECIHWAPSSAWVFRAYVGRHLRRVPLRGRPDTLLGAPSFQNPLPPFGRVVGAWIPGVTLTEFGVVVMPTISLPDTHATRASGTWMAWEEVSGAEADGTVLRLLRNKLHIRIGSRRLAAHLADLIQKLVATPSDARPLVLATERNRWLDAVHARTQWDTAVSATRPVQFLATILWVYLFLACPYLVWTLGFETIWMWLIASLLLQTSAIAGFSLRARRRMETGRLSAWIGEAILIGLCPTVAIRARDRLFSECLALYHPIVVSTVVEPLAERARSGAAILREMAYPRFALPEGAALEAERALLAARCAESEGVHHFLRSLGIDPQQWIEEGELAIPRSSGSYCPRCLDPFQLSPAHCAACDRPTIPSARGWKSLGTATMEAPTQDSP